MAGQQLDAATAIKVRAYLVVLHLTPLPEKSATTKQLRTNSS